VSWNVEGIPRITIVQADQIASALQSLRTDVIGFAGFDAESRSLRNALAATVKIGRFDFVEGAVGKTVWAKRRGGKEWRDSY
jgi:hypothetical protein